MPVLSHSVFVTTTSFWPPGFGSTGCSTRAKKAFAEDAPTRATSWTAPVGCDQEMSMSFAALMRTFGLAVVPHWWMVVVPAFACTVKFRRAVAWRGRAGSHLMPIADGRDDSS